MTGSGAGSAAAAAASARRMKDRLVVMRIVMDSKAMWVRALGTNVITDVLGTKGIQQVNAETFDETLDDSFGSLTGAFIYSQSKEIIFGTVE